jgi:uncharacterized membrane protein YsdA (DUF1294 family)/cold shock CspA family protein
MPAQPPRKHGVLKSWNDDRGFGFISSSGQTLFVHISAFASGSPRPQVGDAVTFDVASADGRDRAINARGPARSLRAAPRSASVVPFLALIAFAALAAAVAYFWGVPLWLAILYAAASLVAFAVYRSDKVAAVRGNRRVPESTLLLLGLIGGWPGALVAQRSYRHKTIKARFQAAFWGTVALNIAAFVYVCSPAFATLVL